MDTNNEKKRKSIAISDKLKVIAAIEGGSSQASVVKSTGINKSTVTAIWKDRNKIKEDAVTYNPKFEKVRKCDFQTVDSALLEWFQLQRSRNIPISGPILKEKSIAIAQLQNVEKFSASKGWLDSWKRRHGITFKIAAGEGACVDISNVEDWKASVWPAVSNGFKACDIYNADETGLFFRLLPQKTMEFKGKECHGGKMSKDRITVLFCANADGTHKLKPLVIGKSARPRCFKNIRDLSQLPVHYESNTKAWMTGKLFSNWLKKIDMEMRLLGKKILLVLNNCSAHVAAEATLTNIKLVFLPPNATSMVQPLDRGIINSFKMRYRTNLLKKIIARMDSNSDPRIDVLEAIYGITGAWNSVTSSCVANCFRSSGLVQGEVDIQEIADSDHGLSGALSGVSLEHYVEVDQNLITCEEPTLEEIAHTSSETSQLSEATNDGEEDDEEDLDRAAISSSEALKMIDQLKYFVTCAAGDEKLLENLNGLENFVAAKSVSAMKQSKIIDFFSSDKN